MSHIANRARCIRRPSSQSPYASARKRRATRGAPLAGRQAELPRLERDDNGGPGGLKVLCGMQRAGWRRGRQRSHRFDVWGRRSFKVGLFVRVSPSARPRARCRRAQSSFTQGWLARRRPTLAPKIDAPSPQTHTVGLLVDSLSLCVSLSLSRARARARVSTMAVLAENEYGHDRGGARAVRRRELASRHQLFSASP